MICPWCGSPAVEQIAAYGSLLMTSQWYCNACRSPFERVRHRGDSDDSGHTDRGVDG